MEKISIVHKKKSIFIFLLVLSLPIFLLIPSGSSAIPDYDVNSDGLCNILDIVQVANHLGESGASGWIREDVDKNGDINMLDMIFISNYYGVSVDTGDSSPPSSARIQKMSVCYSGRIANSAVKQYIAQHFDLVDTSINYPTDVQWVKSNAVNPNIKVIGYFDVVFDSSGNQEDWYVHNTGGNRVTSSGTSSNYVMNPCSGWANYYIQRAETALNSKTMYDGIFCDDDWYDPTYDNEYWSSSPSKWEISMPNWKSSMVTFMGNLKTTFGNDIVMANVEPPSALGVIGDQTKAVILEHFVHKLETSVTDNGRPVSAIIDTIGYLHGQAEKGNIIVGLSGCSAGTGYEDWAKFCYACFAFAVVDPSKAYFAWNFMGSSPTTNPTWFQWMDDYVLGTPTDTYHSITGNVYERTFTNYYVIANLNNLGSSVTFTFNGASHTLEGKHTLFIQK